MQKGAQPQFAPIGGALYVALMRGAYSWVLAWATAVACCPSSAPPVPAMPAPSDAPEPPGPPALRAAPKPLRPVPLFEDEAGVVGAPRDDTAFEFEAEVSADEDVDPVLDGVPAPATAVLRSLPPYLEARRARLAGMSPDGREMLVLTRLSDTTHVHLVRSPLGVRQQVTFGREPVNQAAFIPGDAGGLVYRSDVGGNEDYQLFQLGLQSRALGLLTDGSSRHGPFRWAPRGRHLGYTSNARNGVDMDLYVRDFDTGSTRRVAQAEGQWVIQSWSKDASQLLAQEFRSVSHSTIHLVDVATGATRAVTPQQPGVSCTSAVFHPSAERFYVSCDRDDDFLQLFEVSLPEGQWRRLTPNLRWDVERMALSGDGRLLAFSANEDGVSVLRVLDTQTRRVRVLKGIPAGEIDALKFVGKSHTLAFALATATRPADAYTYDPEQKRLVRWTASEVGGVAPAKFVSPKLVRYPSFDQLKIPAYYFRPDGRGPFPVLIWVHGGPEGQSRPTFDPIIQYFVAELGVAVVVPNVRGSDGYGKRFRDLDNGGLRLDSVRDIGALLEWVAARPELDAARVGIHGASYGGYMVLAALVEYGDRIVAGCDVVGISNFVTFLEATREYRRDLRRPEYGDERNAEMREYLQKISPANHADRIRSALLVTHGANDPRVPVEEARQVVEAVRGSGGEAWFFLAPNEGHGFRKRRNRDRFYQTMATFFERHLLRAKLPEVSAAVDDAEPPATEVEASPDDGRPPSGDAGE